MRIKEKAAFVSIAFALLLIASAALKLYASQLLAWEVDYVPVIARGQMWIDGGDFPVVGTLSSVGAFNMPFLVWMQLPALLVTRDVRLALVSTQLAFNLLTTCIVYRLGSDLFDRRAGLLAAMLFSFSDVGIAGAYTAWAQLQLPLFFTLFATFLIRWKRQNRAWQAALTVIAATAALMTHFAAALLYGVLAVMRFALGLPLNRRGLLAGLLISFIMLAPYLVYQASVDFVDLKAHVARHSRVSAEILAQFDSLKPMGRAAKDRAAEAKVVADAPPPETQNSRLERGLTWLLGIPSQIVAGLRLTFSGDLLSLRQHQPSLYAIFPALRILLEACFWYGFVAAAYQFARQWRAALSARAIVEGRRAAGWRLAQNLMVKAAAGRNLTLVLLIVIFITGLCLARAGPDTQPSYTYGVVGLQFLTCAYAVYSMASHRRLQFLASALVFIYAGLGAYDAVIKVFHHDPAQDSPLNLNLYSSINDAARFIAFDWTEEGAINVSYDLLPEMPQLWWVLPWHTVDESYRLGMALDYLLMSYFGLHNSNRNPLGISDNPDYIVTSARGLARYHLAEFQLAQFGALYVLKPG